MYLAVDPGRGRVDSIGVATFESDGTVVQMGQFTLPDFTVWLEKLPRIEAIIYEEYRIYKRMAKAHIGSRVETVESIGTIKSFATRRGYTCLVAQRADILGAAQKLFQIKLPADHTVSHQYSALLHGLYYLYGKGIIKSALEVQMECGK